jgi:hypothetical protein
MCRVFSGAGVASATSAAIPNLWVEIGVKQISDKIGTAVDGRYNQDGGLYQWQVMPFNREQ